MAMVVFAVKRRDHIFIIRVTHFFLVHFIIAIHRRILRIELLELLSPYHLGWVKKDLNALSATLAYWFLKFIIFLTLLCLKRFIVLIFYW